MRVSSELYPGLAGTLTRPARAGGDAAAAAWAADERLPRALFAALLVGGVLPIWLVAHVPTQDGANHVESIMALLRLPGSALLQHYYLANWGLQPNWLTQLLFMGLVQVVSPAVAEKLVLTGYLVALPLAFRVALPRGRRGAWAALGVFPFVHSYPFHMGFWNFSYSVALFFVAVGLWYRTRGRIGLRRGLALAAVWVVLFVAHSVSTAAALAAIAAIVAWRAGLSLWRARGAPARCATVLRGWLLRALATGAAAAPAIVLFAVFLVRQPKPDSFRPPLWAYLKHFATLYALVSYHRLEIVLGGLTAIAIGGSVLLALRARGRRLSAVDGWLAAALLATALYLAMPDATADGAQINDRLMLYPFFAAVLWMGWAAVPVARVRTLALALAALFVAASGLRLARYREIDGWIAEYRSVAPAIEVGSTILPLNLSPYGLRAGHDVEGRKTLSYRVAPFTHVAGWIATERGGVDLDNSQATTRHAPLRWRPERDPFHALPTAPFGMESEPPCIQLSSYARTGGRIDYVLLAGDAIAAGRDRCGAMLLAELRAGWQPVVVSQPRGLVQVWRLRAGGPGSEEAQAALQRPSPLQ